MGAKTIFNRHNGNFIARHTAEEYVRVAREDEANGWAKARDAAMNKKSHDAYRGQMFYRGLEEKAGSPPLDEEDADTEMLLAFPHLNNCRPDKRCWRGSIGTTPIARSERSGCTTASVNARNT